MKNVRRYRLSLIKNYKPYDDYRLNDTRLELIYDFINTLDKIGLQRLKRFKKTKTVSKKLFR